MRRRPSRRELHLPVSFGLNQTAVTANVSFGGFEAETSTELVPGATIHGFILILGTEVPFSGRVAWAKQGNPSVMYSGRIGVAFYAVPAQLAELFVGPVHLRSTLH